MNPIFKSSEGERLVRERYQRFLEHWPVPNEQLHIPTTQGSTFVVVSGPKEAPPLLLLHGSAANSAMWMGDVRIFARAFRVYCIDMIGEPGFSAAVRPSLRSDAYAVWLDDVFAHFSIDSASIVGSMKAMTVPPAESLAPETCFGFQVSAKSNRGSGSAS